MAVLTQLSPLGVPGRQYGDFDRTPSLPRDVDEITRLATCGAPGRRYGSFDRSPTTFDRSPGILYGDTRRRKPKYWYNGQWVTEEEYKRLIEEEQRQAAPKKKRKRKRKKKATGIELFPVSFDTDNEDVVLAMAYLMLLADQE